MRFVCRFCFASLLTCFIAVGAIAQARLEIRVVHAETLNPVAGANVNVGRQQGTTSLPASDAQGFTRAAALEAGEYVVEVSVAGYYPVRHELVLAPRQALTLTLELTPLKKTEQQVQVLGSYSDINPQQTGSSRLLSHDALEKLPSPIRRDVPTLAENLVPGATLSHDNFVHVRGNELSLHEFINGVSFLDNSHQHFTPGISPEIFEAVNIMTGGFPAEFGNRFGGILDITTRSGSSLKGHGSATVGVGSVLNNDATAEDGGSSGKLGYYVFAGGFSSDRFLNPPVPNELHDFGFGARGAAQLDYQCNKNLLKLLVTAGRSDFDLPNREEDQALGRDAERRLRSQTAILTWQRVISSRALVATSIYERTVSDRLLPTSDPFTELANGSRSTLTAGIKSDFTYALKTHTFKAGVDLSRLRLLENLQFDPRDQEAEAAAFDFHDRLRGGQASLYAQDHFTLWRDLTLDAGMRWDYFDVVNTNVQVSPRFGIAYHLRPSRSVLHFAYNRFFSPPPLEYALLASFLGNHADEPVAVVGSPRPYVQNFFEAGWNQQIGSNFNVELNAYKHRGRNAFENSEIGRSRLFVPTNFARATAEGLEVSLGMRQLKSLGLSGRLQYSVGRTYFFGPVSGGFAGHEALQPGERILPAFDQIHTATASLFYRHPWRNFWAGSTLKYGSGTPAEDGALRLPQHLTADLAAGLTIWSREPQSLALELNALNLSDSRYQIAKESELTPIQFAARRVFSGRLKWYF